jgi:alpha-ketoglutarate-dependent taurine dioxygenase
LSVLKVENLLKLLSESTRATLANKDYCITVPPEFRKTENKDESILGSLLTSDPKTGRLALRFRDDIFTPLTGEAGLALEELKSVLLGPKAQAEVVHLTPQLMPRGSIVIMDNRRWLHGRNQVKDPRRHLKRVRWDARLFGDE